MNGTTRRVLVGFTAALLMAPLAAPQADAVDSARSEIIGLYPAIVQENGVLGVEYRSGGTLVARSTDAAPTGVAAETARRGVGPVQFRAKTERDGVIELGPEKSGR